MQNDPEDEEAVKEANDVEAEPGATEGFCFLVEIGRKRICGDFLFDRPLRDAGRLCGLGFLPGRRLDLAKT